MMRVSDNRFQMMISGTIHFLAASKSFSVNAAFDWNNPSQLTLTVQFHDQYIQCSEELIALVTQKLRETFQFNDNGNHQSWTEAKRRVLQKR